MADGGPTLYRYRAIELATGRIRSGEQSGTTPYEVRASLRRLGLDVERLDEVHDHAAPSWLLPLVAAWNSRQRARRRLAKADLCDGIATMLQAGVPLDQAVATLAASSARTVPERRLLRAIRDRLREGVALSDALEMHPGWFDQFDQALIQAGQQAGDLPDALRALGDHHLRAGAIGQKIASALAYPALLLVAGIAVVVFMSVKTLPQLIGMIVQGGKPAPWLTLQVMAVGQGIATWWPLIALAIPLGVAGWTLISTRIAPSGRWTRLIHGNSLARLRGRIRVAHVAQALARLRRAGLPLTDSLVVVAESAGDRPLRALLLASVEAVRRGEDLSAVIGRSRLLDQEFAQLLQLGERSGELTAMLERIADRFRRGADRAADRLAAILGPAAIIVLALLIGTVVLACVLPLAQLGDLV